MLYTVYKTINRVNGDFYIGQHATNDPYDSYLGSGKILKRAIKKYGVENFYKEILYIFDNKKDMNDMEQKLITEELISANYCYNICKGGEGGALRKNFNHSQETKDKISIANKGRKVSNETRKKLSKIRIEKYPNGCLSLEGSKRISEHNRIRNKSYTREQRIQWQAYRKKSYKVIDPYGNEYNIHGLRQFCQEHNIHQGNMSRVAKGQLKHVKGWKCYLQKNS